MDMWEVKITSHIYLFYVIGGCVKIYIKGNKTKKEHKEII